MLLRQGLGTFERQGGPGPAVLGTFERQVGSGTAFWTPLNVKLALKLQFWPPLNVKLALDWHCNGVNVPLELRKLALNGSGTHLAGLGQPALWSKKGLWPPRRPEAPAGNF